MKVYGAPLSAGKSFNRAFQQPEALKRLENVAHVEIVLTHGPLSSSMWTGVDFWVSLDQIQVIFVS